MRGVPLEIDEKGARFNSSLPVLVGFYTTVQNALVNLGTARGSDPIFDDRGTYLQVDGARGAMLDTVRASHATNFAALDTLVFLRRTEMAFNTDQLQKVTLEITALNLQKLSLAVQVTSSLGEIVGRLFPI